MVKAKKRPKPQMIWVGGLEFELGWHLQTWYLSKLLCNQGFEEENLTQKARKSQQQRICEKIAKGIYKFNHQLHIFESFVPFDPFVPFALFASFIPFVSFTCFVPCIPFVPFVPFKKIENAGKFLGSQNFLRFHYWVRHAKCTWFSFLWKASRRLDS